VATPSAATNRVAEATPEAKKLVVVTFVNVAFRPITFWSDVSPKTVNVLVTVELAATNPPNKLNVEVAEAPRAVTVARVSEQPLPSLKHTLIKERPPDPFVARTVFEAPETVGRTMLNVAAVFAASRLVYPPPIEVKRSWVWFDVLVGVI
jgi:hypothetical protein